MKLSIQSFARKLSIPSPKRTWSGGRKQQQQRSLSRSEAPSFASASSSSSSSDDALAAASRSSSTPRSVLRASEQIPRREMEAVLRRLGHGDPSDDDIAAFAAVVAEADAPAAPGAEEDDLMEAFRVFDADGDGRITAEELRAVMESILGEGCSLDDCRRMIGGVDADGDGFVGFQDFARMMMVSADDARRSFL